MDSLQEAVTKPWRASDFLVPHFWNISTDSQPPGNCIAILGPPHLWKSFWKKLTEAFNILILSLFHFTCYCACVVIILFPAKELTSHNSVIENQVSSGKNHVCRIMLAFPFSFSFFFTFSFLKLVSYYSQSISFYSWEHRKSIIPTLLASRCGSYDRFWPVECGRSDVLLSQPEPPKKSPRLFSPSLLVTCEDGIVSQGGRNLGS